MLAVTNMQDTKLLLKKFLEENSFIQADLESFNTFVETELQAILEENKVSAIISDIAMPGMNGMDLLAEVKKKYQGIPMLMITGFAGQYKSDHAMAAGADGFIIKPFKNIDIINKVKNFV